VLRFTDHVEILMTDKSATEGRGYWICRDPDAEPESKTFKLSPTPDKGIYQFEFLNEKPAPLLVTNQSSYQPARERGSQSNSLPSK
jgi:hypothetical protein